VSAAGDVLGSFKTQAEANAKFSGLVLSHGCWAHVMPGRRGGFDVVRAPDIGDPVARQVAALSTPAPAPAETSLPIELASPSSTRFQVIEAEEFAGGEITEPEWLVAELFPRRGIGLVWGESGAGKSFWCLDVACAVTRGVKWRDRATEKGRAVIVVAEGAEFYRLRLRAYAKRYAVPLAELPAIVPAPVNLSNTKEVAEFVSALKERGASIVCFDTLNQCAVGTDENSAKDMGQVIALLKYVAREVDGLALVVHHGGKDGARGPRGSSVLRPAVDVEVRIEADCATVEKLKDSATGDQFPFTLSHEKLGVSHKTGRDYGSMVVEHIESKPYRGPRLSDRAQVALGVCEDMLSEAKVDCVSEADWRMRCLPFMDPKSKNRGRNFDTARRELDKYRRLKFEDGKVGRFVISGNSIAFDEVAE
jgi:hypothetical protein